MNLAPMNRQPGMMFSMIVSKSTVVRVPELTNAVIAGLVASCAPAAVMPLSVSPLVGQPGAFNKGLT